MTTNLYEFIRKRCGDLGISMSQLQDRTGLSWGILSGIKNGKGIRAGTKQKLAEGLLCSIGDIQAALSLDAAAQKKVKEEEDMKAYPVTPEPEPIPVMQTVDKLEQMVQEEYPEESRKPSVATTINKLADKLEGVLTGKPPKETPGVPEPATNKTKPKTKKIAVTDISTRKNAKVLERATAAEGEPAMTVTEYKQKLKNICLQLLSEEDPFDTDSVALFAVIGKQLLRELVKE